MVITFASNIASMSAQRHLSQISTKLNSVFRRLSSGERISTAADDPAGLAISERMRAKIRGLSRAQLSCYDGISLAQTAEGALNEISSILIRNRELAVQASSDVMSASDKDSLQLEFSENVKEITRIARAASFNDQQLLDGEHSFSFQVDAGTNPQFNTITLTLADMKATALGIDVLDIGGSGDSFQAIDQIDVAIDDVVRLRGRNGAFINRMSSTISYLGTTIGNLSAAESRIRDVDVAKEVAEMTKLQIMQQSAIHVLKIANQQPKHLLGLLK